MVADRGCMPYNKRKYLAGFLFTKHELKQFLKIDWHTSFLNKYKLINVDGTTKNDFFEITESIKQSLGGPVDIL